MAANLTVSDEQLKALVAGAILQLYTPEARDKLIEESIAAMLTEKPSSGSGYYGSERKTRLQSAFDSAVDEQMRAILAEQLQTPKYQALLRKVAGEAFAKVFDPKDSNQSVIVDRIAAKFATWISDGLH